MNREYSENEKILVDSYVELLILLHNPHLRPLKNEIIKNVFETLDETINDPVEELEINEDDSTFDGYYEYLFENG